MKSKLNFLLLALLMIGSSLGIHAQRETLFGKGASFGGFGAILTEFGQVNGEMRASMGGGGGFVIEDLFIGAYGLGSTDYERLINGDDPVMDIAHGGLWIGYNYNTFNYIHLYTSARIGWGGIGFDLDDDPFDYRGRVDAIFAFTPEVGVELNLTKWMRVAGAIGYRYVDGVNTSGFKDKDFSGVTGSIGFRFGWFGRPRYSGD